MAGNPFTFWRTRVRELECRWRERVQLVRECQTEVAHPADANDEAALKEVEEIIAERVLDRPQAKTAPKDRGKRQERKKR